MRFDLGMAVTVVALLTLAALVGLGLAILLDRAVSGLGRLREWWQDRRRGGHLIDRRDFSDLSILMHHGYTWREWEAMTDAERAWCRDQFFRSKGL